jgi:Tol biopolymer transport system component
LILDLVILGLVVPAAYATNEASATESGAIELVSVSPSGVPGDGYSRCASISADGRFVVFSSSATNLVPVEPNAFHFLVRDRQTATTAKLSPALDEGTFSPNHVSCPIVSANGRFVVFRAHVESDEFAAPEAPDIFVVDRLTGTTEQVSVDVSGQNGNGISAHPSISANGRFVAFDHLSLEDFTFNVYVFATEISAERQSGLQRRRMVSGD